jgi:predicted nucleotidyltransferase
MTQHPAISDLLLIQALSCSIELYSAQMTMELANPIQSVIPGAYGAVLGVLARTDLPLSGRRVAELTEPKFSQRRVNDVLIQLAAAGVVLREIRPPANYYRLNHDHVAAEGIVALASMWATLLARVRAELENWSLRPEAAWLFGSAARREARENSDIDILIIRPAGGLDGDSNSDLWERQIDDLAEKVRIWSGNPCEILEMDLSAVGAAVERDDRLVRDLREQAVVLAGEDAWALLRGRVAR